MVFIEQWKRVAFIFTFLVINTEGIRSFCHSGTREAYDFVIIGGGTAGCVLASGLSEIPQFSVALLEAGGEPPLISKIPRLALLMQMTEVDWNYTSVTQRNALFNYRDRVMNMTRGKMLGGSGSMNIMNFFRGNKLDYCNWRKLGVRYWEWEYLLQYFKKIENDNEIGIDHGYHGHRGPICITNPGRGDQLINSFFETLTKLGYRWKDPNGDGTQTGYSYSPVNVCDNERQSTYTNYLKPVMSRKNLKVETFAFVEKIIFDYNKRATGVIYKQNGCRKFIKVLREVIVSCGAINSPQLLMLSGIGPRRHLESLNINVISDLPVGYNLMDHLRMEFIITKAFEDIYNNQTLKNFFQGLGPLTEFLYGSAFINTRYSRNWLYPDIQLILSAYGLTVFIPNKLAFILAVSISRPKSRGIIRLASNDPYDYPLIDPRYLSDERDVKVLAEGAKIASSILDSMNTEEQGYDMVDTSVPSCNNIDKESNEYWYCLVRNKALTLYHYSGTCRMGSKYQKSSVVDNNLNVIGVENVRVIDASVMPAITTGNIQAVVIMIAERGADLIKAQYTRFEEKTKE